MKELIGIVLSAAIGAIAVLMTQWFQAQTKNSELQLQYLNIALGILREDPEKSQINAVRGWAVDIINASSPVRISEDTREELIQRPLNDPLSVLCKRFENPKGKQLKPDDIADCAYRLGVALGIAGILQTKDHVANPTQTPLQHGAIDLLQKGGDANSSSESKQD